MVRIVAVVLALGAGESNVCVKWTTEARYRPYGYDHVVRLQSACRELVECAVTTNVNPEPVRARVAPGAHVEVVTWVGSPAREFTASVSCSRP